jgi:hypothetical protein
MHPWTLLGIIVISLAAWILLSGFLKTWRLYHGVRLITCPENLETAAVNVAAFDAAKWFALSGESSLHLERCSRWPEMAGCEQECLSQIEAAPLSCRLQSVVTSWYAGKECNFCGREIGRIVWHERPPAVRMSDGSLRTWKEIAPADLPKAFVGGEPVCWACCTVETFRAEHPRMVIERVRTAVPHHAIPPSVTVY